MELLTTDDILNKKFTATKFREGYDIVEVDDFLDEVLNTLRAYEGENGDLKSKLAAAERRVAELTRQNAAQAAAAAAAPAAAPEPAPAPTPEPAPAPAPAAPARLSEPESATGMLQLAQKLHDDYVRSGQEEGDRIVTEARTEGERIVREAQETSARTLGQLEQERGLLERKIDELRQFERDYRMRLQSYLENLLGDLNNRGAVMPGGDKESGRSI
ncbi:DivIVA domain-containing protein [Flavimobilis sp. GY10621]|uniref:Cell wall synthesis protein Wag31 n=1 Tax=Flavimobilis rhizosphaerae TaxID=2775421 RepID=A0ABR9DTH7_9MICO|nr:DivIVA domain-containing protein [Flavimobilis rhizosphaerae]MBD9699716.1 DivIVA domain-containing protein [Flavimobilis rhizosphaerae]